MIVAIDTETGGLNSETCALLSISACLLDDPSKTFNVFIKPDPKLEITMEAATVNGYNEKLWAERGAVPLRTALERFKMWLPPSGNDPLAHNAPFDKAFLEAAERQTGFRLYLRYRWRCTMAGMFLLNDAFDLGTPDLKLETLARLCGHWGPDYKRGEHQSLDDVLACAAGWRWLVERAREGRSSTKSAEHASIA